MSHLLDFGEHIHYRLARSTKRNIHETDDTTLDTPTNVQLGISPILVSENHAIIPSSSAGAGVVLGASVVVSGS